MRLAPLKADHEYQLCDDPDCPRFPCRVFKEGYAAGWQLGYVEGEATGYAQGYSDGYGEGVSQARE